MDENRESQELAIPGKIVKRNTGIKIRVQNILRRPAVQAITKAPTEQTSPVEQTPGEMSVERAREILKYIVNIPERPRTPTEVQLTLYNETRYQSVGKRVVQSRISLVDVKPGSSDENRIVYPDDLDKSPSPLDKGQTQFSKPKSELPPKQ